VTLETLQPTLSANVLANFADKAWTAALAIVCVPLYLRFLGIEAYGLVGFFSSTLVLLSVLDLGLGTTLNRELAMQKAGGAEQGQLRDLTRTLEIVYGSVAVLIGALWVCLAPWLADHWVQARQIPRADVHWAMIAMGLVLLAQWPTTLYAGGLMGLEQQVAANAITAAVATLRAAGALVILWLVSRRLVSFFLWNAVASLAGTVALRHCLWRLLAAPGAARFRMAVVKKVYAFSLGVVRISLATLLLQSLDKLLLSKILPLEQFGYYMLGLTVASGLYVVASSVHAVVYPRFSWLVSKGETAGIVQLYHLACQGLTVALAPLALSIAAFPRELVLLWTGNPVTAQNCAALVCLLTLGCMLNAFLYVSYALVIASGWTSFVVRQNLVATLALVPALFWLAGRYGGIAAAAAWMALNLGYVLVAAPILHHRLLPGELGRWYLRDLAWPLGAALAPVALARMALPATDDRLAIACTLAMVGAASLLAALTAAPTIRACLAQWLASRRQRWLVASRV
jgi:O-antigen/teichoic acid export membrane protein